MKLSWDWPIDYSSIHLRLSLYSLSSILLSIFHACLCLVRHCIQWTLHTIEQFNAYCLVCMAPNFDLSAKTKRFQIGQHEKWLYVMTRQCRLLIIFGTTTYLFTKQSGIFSSFYKETPLEACCVLRLIWK